MTTIAQDMPISAQASHAGDREFASQLSQTNGIYNWYLSLPSLVLDINRTGQWLAQSQDNVMEWDIRSWCQWPDFPVGQHYKITMSAPYHKSSYDLRCFQDVKLQQPTNPIIIFNLARIWIGDCLEIQGAVEILPQAYKG